MGYVSFREGTISRDTLTKVEYNVGPLNLMKLDRESGAVLIVERTTILIGGVSAAP